MECDGIEISVGQQSVVEGPKGSPGAVIVIDGIFGEEMVRDLEGCMEARGRV